MIFVLFKTKSTMITNEFGEILHRYIYMGFRKALKFHQFYFGDEFQNLTAVKLEENDKLQKVLEEIKEEDKDIEDAEGKEVNVGLAGIGSLKPQIQFFQSLMFMELQVTEEELSEQTEGSGCFVFSFLISSLRSFSYFILVISWLHGLIFLPLRSLYTILIWNKNGFFGFWYYYVLVFKSNEVISKSMELEGGIDEHIENENVENGIALAKSIYLIIGFKFIWHYVGHFGFIWFDYQIVFWNKVGSIGVYCICVDFPWIWKFECNVMNWYCICWMEGAWSVRGYQSGGSMIVLLNKVLLQSRSLVSSNQRLFQFGCREQDRINFPFYLAFWHYYGCILYMYSIKAYNWCYKGQALFVIILMEL
ncbi:unnamed protein product, partial [Brassica rapa]